MSGESRSRHSSRRSRCLRSSRGDVRPIARVGRRHEREISWRRAAVVSRSPRPRGKGSWMLSCRKDAPPNGGAPVTGVSERQATLHRWAFLNRARQEPWRARCGESRTPGSASGLGKRTSNNAGTAPQADSTDCYPLQRRCPAPRRPVQRRARIAFRISSCRS